jgi:hypothetical protein
MRAKQRRRFDIEVHATCRHQARVSYKLNRQHLRMSLPQGTAIYSNSKILWTGIELTLSITAVGTTLQYAVC